MYQAIESYFNFVFLENPQKEPTAENKLKTIWGKYKQDFRFVLNDKEFALVENNFLRSFEIRHALMHHKPGKEDKAKEFNNMLVATDGFRAVMEMWILQELNFKEDQYKQMLKKIGLNKYHIRNFAKGSNDTLNKK
jgi:hypothetical protein